MPCLIICTYPDGRILVNALSEPPPGSVDGAQEAASLDEAASMVQDVLGGEAAAGGMEEAEPEEGGATEAGDEPRSHEDSEAGPEAMGGEGAPGGAEGAPGGSPGQAKAQLDELLLQQGYDRGRKGNY